MSKEEFIKECENQVKTRKSQKADLFSKYKTATESERFYISGMITKIDYEIGAINNTINELRRV